MTFSDLKAKFEKYFGVDKLADIARELEVTPQVVSNWKSRDQVPYKYVKILRDKISKSRSQNIQSHFADQNIDYNQWEKDPGIPIAKAIGSFLAKFYGNILVVISIILTFLACSYFYIKFVDIPEYISSCKILPKTSASGNNAQSSLQSFASRFGISTGSSNGTSSITSSILIPSIIRSRYFAKTLLNKQFYTKKYDKKLELISILNGSTEDRSEWSLKKRIKAVRRIRKMISVRTSTTSPLLTVSVKSFEPEFAKNIADSLLVSLGLVIEDFKNSNLKEKKNFIEKRIEEVSNELERSENNLKEFRERNRKIISSPNLMLTQERLLRELQVKTQMYITMKTELEMVQIEEIGRSKMIQVLDTPELPLRRNDPNGKEIMYATLFLSIIFSFIFVYLIDWFNDNKNDIMSFKK
tara:strand:+ start:611 stop:1846 length:1236 start_codon:yes stop_codon:yes gene_type:complete